MPIPSRWCRPHQRRFGPPRGSRGLRAWLGHASAYEILNTYRHLWRDSDNRTLTAVDAVLALHDEPQGACALARLRFQSAETTDLSRTPLPLTRDGWEFKDLERRVV